MSDASSSSPIEVASYVPTTARRRPWVILFMLLPIAGAIASAVMHRPYTAPIVVLSVALVVVVGPAVAASRTRIVVQVDPDARAVHVDEHRLLVGKRRSSARFDRKRPKVERVGTILGVHDGGEGVSLYDVPASAIEGLRERLVSSLASWTPAPSIPPSAEISLEVHERDETRALVVALLSGDLELAQTSLARGANPDGHDEAGGRGAPLFLARLRRDSALETMLRGRGATASEVEPASLRTLVLLAETTGLSDFAELLESASADHSS